MITTNDRLVEVYNEAYKFLSEKVSPDLLNTELSHYSEYKPSSINDVFRGMVVSLKNKAGYMHFIADVDAMKEMLKGFNPKEVFYAYGTDVGLLLDQYKQKFGGKYKIDSTNNKNSWVIYSKGVVSCAKFLSEFSSLKDFDTFVRSFFYNEYSVIALPMLLSHEIFGFGFALACDFLKEQGYQKFGKPDVHLRDIFSGVEIVSPDADEYEVFKTIVKIARLVGKEPVVVDKVFWLIGSGFFNVSNVRIERQKEKFIEYMRSITS